LCGSYKLLLRAEVIIIITNEGIIKQVSSLMQRIAGSVVTNDLHHGARRGIYGAHEFYTQPNPVANSN